MITEFRVGEVFAKSLSIFFANFVSFMTIALIVHTPVLLLSMVEQPAPGQKSGAEAVANLLQVVLTPIATGAITFGVLQQLRGQHTPAALCLSAGFSRMLPVLGVAICVGLATAVGFVLLIIPGFIVMSMLWVAIPVAVVEKGGVSASLSRSQELTKDNRLNIFGLFLLVTVIQIVIAFVVGATLVAAPDLAISVVLTLVGVFFSAWQASAQAVSYYYLRSMKETIDIDGIASVFD